jgi:hypothetical protein
MGEDGRVIACISTELFGFLLDFLLLFLITKPTALVLGTFGAETVGSWGHERDNLEQ